MVANRVLRPLLCVLGADFDTGSPSGARSGVKYADDVTAPRPGGEEGCGVNRRLRDWSRRRSSDQRLERGGAVACASETGIGSLELGANPSSAENLLRGGSSEEPGHCGHFGIPAEPQNRLIAFSEKLSVSAEKFRLLSSQLQRLHNGNLLKSVLVTSAGPGEGKTMVAANLAITLASQQRRTVLIDGDLRHRTATRLFGVAGHAGPLNWWRENLPAERILYKCLDLPLWLCPAPPSDNAVNLLQSSGLQQFVSTLSALFTWIVIDSPPLSLFADAASWSTAADGIVLVARSGITPVHSFRQALKMVEVSKVVATVLNEADVGRELQYYNHYYMKHGVP